MKNILFVIFSISIVFNCGGQKLDDDDKLTFETTAELGYVANSPKDGKMAYGASLAIYIKTKRMKVTRHDGNYFSVSAKGVLNPYKNVKIDQTPFNNVNDGLNYLLILGGYRIAQSLRSSWYGEPRVGLALDRTGILAPVVSPKAGLAVNGFDIGIFIDAAFAGRANNLGKKNFLNPGISIGYIF